MAEKDVIVMFKKKKSECRVVPGEVNAKASDSITFTNITGGDIKMNFPNDTLWSASPAATLTTGSSTTGTLADSVCGFFPFAIYCEIIEDYAEGNSHPAFIVR